MAEARSKKKAAAKTQRAWVDALSGTQRINVLAQQWSREEGLEFQSCRNHLTRLSNGQTVIDARVFKDYMALKP